MKKILIILSVVIVLVIILFIGFKTWINNNTVIWNNDGFELVDTIAMQTPKYNDTGGSWWGHNQQKLANIDDVIFFVEYDNSNLDNGNSSVDNPFTCNLMYIKDDEKVEFDEVLCNSPGNVVADSNNNKVYYIIVEPTGPSNEGGFGWTGESTTVMYEYDYNESDVLLTLVEKHIVTPSVSDGKIRQGTTIDSTGNIAIAYGSYSGDTIIYTYDFTNRLWTHYSTLSNPDNDSLMYCIVVMKDLDHVYTLCQQDTALNGQVYYQYVKFFALENGIWSSHIVSDYRDHPLASEESTLSLNSELYLDGDTIHMVSIATSFFEIIHLTYDGNTYEQIETSDLPKDIENLKIEEFDSKLYYVLYLNDMFKTIQIINVESGDTVFSASASTEYFYMYSHKTSENTTCILLYPDNNGSEGNLYFFEFLH